VNPLAQALLDQLDDQALDVLAARLRPRLVAVDQDRLLTVAEAAARLSVHPKTVTRAAAAGRAGGAVRVGREWRFRASQLAIEPPSHVAAAPAPAARTTRARRERSAADAIRAGGPSS
jgi:excisionase family DNA binding protein